MAKKAKSLRRTAAPNSLPRIGTLDCIACRYRALGNGVMANKMADGSVEANFTGYTTGVLDDGSVLFTQYIGGFQVGLVVIPMFQMEAIETDLTRVRVGYAQRLAALATPVEVDADGVAITSGYAAFVGATAADSGDPEADGVGDAVDDLEGEDTDG